MRLAIASALFISWLSGPTALAGADPPLDPVLAAAMKDTVIPGMGVAVIRDGRLAGVAVRGNRDLAPAAALKSDDQWRILSDTKPMTATLIVLLAEQHKLSLDAPLSATYPELAANARPEYRVITLRQMLHHTTGLPHDSSDIARAYAMGSRDTRPAPEQRVAYLMTALKDAPVAPPGKEANYSNTGFILAAAIAEHAAGVSYEDLMQRELFAPLHMTSAHFGFPAENRGHNGGHVAGAEDDIPPTFYPAGGVSVSLADWAKFCIDQLDGAKGRKGLLATQSYKLLQSPDPVTGNGLAWGVDGTFMDRQGPMLSHTGSDESWYSMVILFPASGNGLLVNANAGADMKGDKADKIVIKQMLPSLAPLVKK
jgi:CubicO group peptidase (beta-lactamase class C family)